MHNSTDKAIKRLTELAEEAAAVLKENPDLGGYFSMTVLFAQTAEYLKFSNSSAAKTFVIGTKAFGDEWRVCDYDMDNFERLLKNEG